MNTMKTLLIVIIVSISLITNLFGQKRQNNYIENEPQDFILAETEESFSLQFIKWGMSPKEIINLIEKKYSKENYTNIAGQHENKIILTSTVKRSFPYKESIVFHFQNDKLYCIIDQYENDIADARKVMTRAQYLGEKYNSLFGKPDNEKGDMFSLKNMDFQSYYAQAYWTAKPDRKYYPETSITLTFNIMGSGKYAKAELEYVLIDDNNEPLALKLMKAIRYSDLDKIKKLLTQEIDYNFKYIYPPLEGKSLAEMTVNSSSKKIVELLLEGGWDINTKNEDGYTPLEIAVNADNYVIEEILKHHNAKGGSAFFVQGLNKYKTKKYYEALNLFEKAIRCDSSNSNYIEFRAGCYFYMEDFTKAITECTKTIQIDSSKISAVKFRGLSYYQLEDYDHAYKDICSYLAYKDDAHLYLLRGVIYYRNEEYQNALIDFNKASELDSSNPQCFKNKGDTYVKLGNNDLAIQNWKKAIELGYRDKQKLEYMINKLKYGE